MIRIVYESVMVQTNTAENSPQSQSTQYKLHSCGQYKSLQLSQHKSATSSPKYKICNGIIGSNLSTEGLQFEFSRVAIRGRGAKVSRDLAAPSACMHALDIIIITVISARGA